MSPSACHSGRPFSVGLPRWSVGTGADHPLPLRLPRLPGEFFVHADSNWRSWYYGDPSLSRFTYVRACNLTNASVGFRGYAGWEMAVFARNLFDENYIQNLTIQAGNSGLILGNPSDPRTIAVALRGHFGG